MIGRPSPHDLAVAHLGEADYAARLVRTQLLDLDERVSIARMALWRAALAWTAADGPFGSYGRQRAIWALRAACRAELRYRRRTATVEHDEPAVEGDTRLADARDEAAPAIRLLDRIAPHQAAVLRMRMAGCEYDEIAAALGISAAASRSAGKRAVRQLRAALHPG